MVTYKVVVNEHGPFTGHGVTYKIVVNDVKQTSGSNESYRQTF